MNQVGQVTIHVEATLVIFQVISGINDVSRRLNRSFQLLSFDHTSELLLQIQSGLADL